MLPGPWRPAVLLTLCCLAFSDAADADVLISQTVVGAQQRVSLGDAYLTQDNGIVDVSPATRTDLLPATHLRSIAVRFIRTSGFCPGQRFYLQAVYLTTQNVLSVSTSTNALPADGADAVFVFGTQPASLDRLWKIGLVVNPSDPSNQWPCNDWDQAVAWIGRFDLENTHLVAAFERTFSPFFILEDDRNSAPCTPPDDIFANTTGAVGLIDAVVSGIAREPCATNADVILQNRLRFWIGVIPLAGPESAFVADSDDIASGDGLIPPCRSSIFSRRPLQCQEPGSSNWNVRFSASSSIDVHIGVTPAAAAVTILDMLLPGQPASSAIAISTELFAVPEFQNAVACLAPMSSPSDGALRRVRCASNALRRLATTSSQRNQVLAIFAEHSIDMATGELIRALLRVPIDLLEATGDLIVFDILSAGEGNIGMLTLTIDGR